jgi:AcrR family transcriptional regulator
MKRMTISLDDDVASLLNQARRRKRQSIRTTVNEVLRHGLAQDTQADDEPPFVVAAQPLGLRLEGADLPPSRQGDEEEIAAFLALSRRLHDAGHA